MLDGLHKLPVRILHLPLQHCGFVLITVLILAIALYDSLTLLLYFSFFNVSRAAFRFTLLFPAPLPALVELV
jgi:hypothetical protein